MSVGGRTHVPRLDEKACETCGGCSWRCPAAVFLELASEKRSLRGALFSSRPYPGVSGETPPCRLACPLGQDVPGYIAAIARGDLAGAAAVVRQTNALPSVCGRVCIASCIRACARASIDQGLDIRGLKRFAVEATAAAEPQPFVLNDDSPRVAVVGAGPAGLAAAHRLGQMGIRPVVLEAADRAGGLLAHVMPTFVLPREALAADIRSLEKQGVEIRTGVRAGLDLPWHELESDYDAVLVTTGAGAGVLSPIPGRGLSGVLHAIDLCRAAAADPRQRVAGPVVVEGGGRAAISAARTARRLGAEVVRVVWPMPRELWPAGSDLLDLAQEEGVELLFGQRAVGLAGASGRLSRVVVREVRFDGESGAGRPREGDWGSELELYASMFVATTLRRPAAEAKPDLEGIAAGVLGNLDVGGDYRLSRPGWYAAGEVATGPATVVDAMATGRLAAEAMARDLAAGRDSRL